jgi:DNA-binding NarL/FixJ family response regulator
VRVLLADDDLHVRSALRLLLENEPGISIVAECPTGTGLVEQVVCCGADVVLLDWELPRLLTSDIERLRTAVPNCHVIALSGRPEHRREALRAGVEFASKGDAPEGLLRLLRNFDVSQSNGHARHEPERDARRPEVLEVVEQSVSQPSAQAAEER